MELANIKVAVYPGKHADVQNSGWMTLHGDGRVLLYVTRNVHEAYSCRADIKVERLHLEQGVPTPFPAVVTPLFALPGIDERFEIYEIEGLTLPEQIRVITTPSAPMKLAVNLVLWGDA